MGSTDPIASTRLKHLRELAATTEEAGRESIQALLDQEDGDCPRFAGIAEHAGERVLLVADSERALSDSLRELVTADPPHSIVALVDLDTNERRSAHTRATVRFAPPTDSQTTPPTPAELADAAITNIEGVAAFASPPDHDRLTSAVEDIIALLGRIDAAGAERLESH